MSQKELKETTQISIRELTVEDKDRIRALLRYGDVSKIAVQVPWLSYQQVINVMNPNHPSQNDRVWKQAITYLNTLPSIELDTRLAKYIKTGEAA